MSESLEIEHRRRLRAERVQVLLQELWGDELPPGPAAALILLIDAVGIDDFHSVQDQLISQGDGLSYQVLAALWQRYRAWPHTAAPPVEPEVGLQLPEGLMERLQSLQLIPTPISTFAPSPSPSPAAAASSPAARASMELLQAAHPRTGPTPAVADLDEFARVGVWEIDPQNDTVAFDAVAAQLIGDGEVAGYSTITRHLQELIHPDDHAAIAAALREAVATETAYRVRFRVCSFDGVITHLISHGRMLHKPSDPSARLTGYLTIDRDGERAVRGEGGSEEHKTIDVSDGRSPRPR
jgi:hypothetical protein